MRVKALINNEEVSLTELQLKDWFVRNTTKGIVTKDITLFGEMFIEKSADGIDFTMSDGSLDNSGERVDPNGWDISVYKKNPIVLWSHDRLRPPIGKMKNIRVEGNKLRGKVEFVPQEIDNFGWSIGEKVKNGFLNSGSVGYLPKRVEFPRDRKDGTKVIVKEQKLFEFSIVNVPCLPSAFAERTEQKIEDSKDTKEDYMTELFLDRSQATSGLGLNAIFKNNNQATSGFEILFDSDEN